MEFINKNEVMVLEKSGVVSKQLLNPDNSNSDKITVTEVHLEPKAVQNRHVHHCSEQVWVGLSGSGKLLLENHTERDFKVGDVVRFEPNEVHGLYNNADTEFVYLSVTSPPIDFSYAYNTGKEEHEKQGTESNCL